MYRFTGVLGAGRLYGFGLTETDLNRMEFNQEALFFDFGYVGAPGLHGLILYMDAFATAEDIAQDIAEIERQKAGFLKEHGAITPDSLRVFPLARNAMQQFRAVPFWAYGTQFELLHPDDRQMFFSGRDDQAIKEYLMAGGLRT